MVDKEQIVTLLQSEDANEIREGAYLAGEHSVVASIPFLVTLLQNKKPSIQEAADSALRKIGGKQVVEACVPLLYSEEASVRNLSMDLLRSLGNSDIPALIALLQEDILDIRIFAADILGSLQSASIVAPLCHALLYDPEVNVRYQAAISLGSLGNKEAIPFLAKALQDEEWVQFAVIESLTKLKATTALPDLLEALHKSSDIVVASIIDALATIGSVKAVPLLLQRLDKAPLALSNLIVKAIVNIMGEGSLNLLGTKETERLRQHLVMALHDEDELVQEAAIKGLTDLGDGASAKTLAQLVEKLDPDKDFVRIEHITKALGKISAPQVSLDMLHSSKDYISQVGLQSLLSMQNIDVFPLLSEAFWTCTRNGQRNLIHELVKIAKTSDQDFFLHVLDKQTDKILLCGALHFLSLKGLAKNADEAILDFLVHPFDEVKEEALLACIALHSSKIESHLQHMLHSQNAEQRMMAVYALGRINLSHYLDKLVLSLDDPSPQVHRVAVEVLGLCPTLSQQVTEKLKQLYDKATTETRISIIESLGKQENIDHSFLLHALSDSEPWVRIRAIEHVAKFKASWALEQLISILDTEENTLVMIKTIEALGEIGGELAFRALLKQINNPAPEIQRIAEENLEHIKTHSGD